MTTLLVASTGGHLKELHQLHTRLAGVHGPFRWATFDTPQARSLLDGEAVDFVPFVGGRDPLNVARGLLAARHILSENDVDTVVSTGSAVALPFFGLARARRMRCYYIESAARLTGPSLTARLISGIPGVHLSTQHRAWADGRWAYGGCVFDAFERAESRGERRDVSKVVVTLGTYRGYGFARLLKRMLKILPTGADVLWQTGDTQTDGLGIAGHAAMPERDLANAMGEADVVVAHAGVGSAIAALEAGKVPLLVPRRLAQGEHVDDHQVQIAGELERRGLGIAREADTLEYRDLLAAASGRTKALAQPPEFAADARCVAAERRSGG